LLLPDNFTPFPKNPLIAKFFVQLGHVDELGSGILNVNRLIDNYASGRKPQFIEGKVFKTIIPVGKEALYGDVTYGQTTYGKNNTLIEELINRGIEKVSSAVRSRLIIIIELIVSTPRIKIADLLRDIDISERVLKENVKMLVDGEFIKYVGSKKTGGYYLSSNLESQLEKEQHDKQHDKLKK
jgi:ATP-dependent DNA helicase RecG